MEEKTGRLNQKRELKSKNRHSNKQQKSEDYMFHIITRTKTELKIT